VEEEEEEEEGEEEEGVVVDADEVGVLEALGRATPLA